MKDFQNLRWSPDEKVFSDRFKELIQTYPAYKKYMKLLESKKFKLAMFAQNCMCLQRVQFLLRDQRS